MFALFGDFAFTELLLVAAVALMVFGKRLPEVAMRAAAQLTRLRRTVTQMWREAGIEEELRKVKRDVEREMPDVAHPKKLIHDVGRQYLESVDPTSEIDEALQSDEHESPSEETDEANEVDGDRESA